MKTARQRLAFRIAEEIVKRNDYEICKLDTEDIYEIIERELPASYEEIEQQLEDLQRKLIDDGVISEQKGPTLLNRLREAVHADKGTPMKIVMEAAIEKCKKLDSLAVTDTDLECW